MTGGFPGQTGGGLRIVTNTEPPMDIPLLQPERTIAEDFIAAVRGEAPAMKAEDILKASEIVLAARESADRGVPVKLPAAV
jgi:predicted dehydrogenase